MSGDRITTHVLDTARGCPASGIRISLDRNLASEEDDSFVWQTIGETKTNSDGRGPGILSTEATSELQAGIYRATFFTRAV